MSGHKHEYVLTAIMDYDVCAVYEGRCKICNKTVSKKYARSYDSYRCFADDDKIPTHEEYLKRLEEEGLKEVFDEDV